MMMDVYEQFTGFYLQPSTAGIVLLPIITVQPSELTLACKYTHLTTLLAISSFYQWLTDYY